MGVDIELTNRCNAKCYFCPRDQTPHQGLMSPEVFDQALHRTVEYLDVAAPILREDPPRVNLCGLGEPLLNKHAASFVEKVAATGMACGLSSNGALLDAERSRALLDAGLRSIFLNVGERDEDYEDIYGLSWERTRDNVARFAEMARGRCETVVVLVDHRSDRQHRDEMEAYWREVGITQFMDFDLINRAGALFVDHMQYEQMAEAAEARALFDQHEQVPMCPAPFLFPIIGYDGHYYLCCSDWKKEVALGNVFDHSFLDTVQGRLEHLLRREPICASCNHDPLNRLTGELRAAHEGQPDAANAEELAEELVQHGQMVAGIADRLRPGSFEAARDASSRRRIPVRSL